jgi:hypothetical protein
LRNTRYRNRAITALRAVESVPDKLLARLSPLGWEHVNLTGDYVWSEASEVADNHDGRLEPCLILLSLPREFALCPLMLQKCAVR